MPTVNLKSSRRRRGFTLNEVLIAMGILAIGITAVASLFPSAIILQKRAVKDAQFQQNTRSAEALLKAKGIDADRLFNFSDNVAIMTPTFTARAGVADIEFDVYALGEVDTVYSPGSPGVNAKPTDLTAPGYGGDASYAAAESLLEAWPEVDRSFPSIEPDPSRREFFYVPLFRRGPEATPYINDWVVYVFVLQAQPEIANPIVGPKYPNDPANGTYTNPNSTPAGAVCANPFDDADYFPKVFRAEVTNWTGSVATLDAGWNVGEILRLGDEVLGDDGEIYRVGDVNTAANTATLNLVSRQTVDSVTLGGGTELDAVWFAMPPNSTEANPPSPVRDIRVLSRGTVKLEDYQ
ncbi:MAG: prepilin-type N-terminal cleavage/methylation domain-containing protein [Planctomycetota bacterium]